MKYMSRQNSGYTQHVTYDDGSPTAVSLSVHASKSNDSFFSLTVSLMTLTSIDPKDNPTVTEVFTINDFLVGESPEDLVLDFMTVYETFEIFAFTRILDDFSAYNFEGDRIIDTMSISELCETSPMDFNHVIHDDDGNEIQEDRYIKRPPKGLTPKLIK